MVCEFQNCAVPFEEIKTGVCFASLHSPKEAFLKTEEIYDNEDGLYNAVRLANGTLAFFADDFSVLVYPMAKVII